MRRREYLTFGGTMLIAGCLDGGEAGVDDDGVDSPESTPSPPPSPTPPDSPTPPGSSTPKADSAEFEIVDIDAPAEIEINEPFVISITVRNTGGKDGSFTSDIYSRSPDSDETKAGSMGIAVPAGETATYETNEASYPYTGTLIFRIDAVDVEFEIQFLPRTLPFGEPYRSPADVWAVAQGIELKDQFTYEDSAGESSTEQASSGQQWAFVNFIAGNDADSSKTLPSASDIILRAGDSQYESEPIRKEEGKYVGGEVEPEVNKRGWIAYEIPQSLAVSDLVVEWFGSTPMGEFGVRWRQGG